jgi:MoaA/NifB/PqqE/SkfB family radical SAM enzyme
MFSLSTIQEYQIEITTYCNAACPQCPRNLNGWGVAPHLPLVHLGRDVIDRTFTEEILSTVRQIFFCGGFGDPIMHPDFLDILRDFRRKNPTVWLYIHSNGGAHDAEYWSEMARIMNGYGHVAFGIDGLEDTLHLYRRSVKYNKVIANAKAFIDAGGKAQWNFIVFRHNEHQVDQVKQIAMELGFQDVLIRNTGRFFNQSAVEEMDRWPVEGRKGVEYYLELPSKMEYRNQSMLFLPRLKQEYSDLREYFDTTEIRCDALIGRKVAVAGTGLVLPCNFLNHHLHDQRYYDANALPGSNDLCRVNGKDQVQEFLESYGLDTLNINHCSLEEVYSSPMWNDLIDSFSKTMAEGRLFECAQTCGTKLTKVWDQGGSIR